MQRSHPPRPRVVLVADWLTGMRGGEKCLEVAARRWPDAPLFTFLHKRGSTSQAIESLPIHTSFLNAIPGIDRLYRHLLPLMPLAVSSLHLPPADLVLSFSHCVAKGVHPARTSLRPTPHVCYCYTPMRYAWQMRDAYFGHVKGLRGRLLGRLLDELRDWDRRTAAHVTHFVAISRTVQARIRESYDRDSVVIYPPADTDYYTPAPVRREGFYLVVSALAPYKRIDLAAATCARLGRQLVVIGAGQDAARLASLAGPDIQLLGWQPDEVIRDHLRRCKALLFPGEEDFGIVPVEAMACGTPVIAFGRGGATETVVPWNRGGIAAPTGAWFEDQTPESLAEAILDFERVAGDFDPEAIRRRAEIFSLKRFEDNLFGYVEDILLGASRGRAEAA